MFYNVIWSCFIGGLSIAKTIGWWKNFKYIDERRKKIKQRKGKLERILKETLRREKIERILENMK